MVCLESTKNYFDGTGKLLKKSDQPNLLDVGVFDNDVDNAQGMTIKSPLILERIWVKSGKSTYTFITNKLPIKAGIDPYNKMIDRIPNDNLISLEEVSD